MILDTDTLLRFFDRDARGHWAVIGRVELAAETELLVVSPFVIADVSEVVRTRYGEEDWLVVFDQLAGGAWSIAPVTPEHLGAMSARVASGASLAEASVAALAKRDE